MEDRMTDEEVKRRIADIAGDVNASEHDRSNARRLMVCGIVRAEKNLETDWSKGCQNNHIRRMAMNSCPNIQPVLHDYSECNKFSKVLKPFENVDIEMLVNLSDILPEYMDESEDIQKGETASLCYMPTGHVYLCIGHTCYHTEAETMVEGKHFKFR